VCVCVCVCARARVRACVRACVLSMDQHWFGFRGNTGSPTMTLYKLSAETNPKQWAYYSNLLAVIIALTAAVPFLQLGQGKSFSVIVERTQTWLRSFTWPRNYQTSTCSQKEVTL